MMKMYVWSNAPFWLAVAQAESVDAARKALLDTELGDSGDGSCPVHDKAREMILGEGPTIWYGTNAEFAITDSAAVEEAEAETAKWKAQLDTANRRIAELEAALKGVMIGGNHLASALMGWLGASEKTFPAYTVDHEQARLVISDPDKYDCWCCWKAIMQARDALTVPESAPAKEADRERK